MVSKRNYAFMTKQEFFTRFEFTPSANALHDPQYKFIALVQELPMHNLLGFKASYAVELAYAEYKSQRRVRVAGKSGSAAWWREQIPRCRRAKPASAALLNSRPTSHEVQDEQYQTNDKHQMNKRSGDVKCEKPE